VKVFEDLLALVTIRRSAGKDSDLDVVDVRAKLETAQSQLEQAREANGETRRILEVLLGRYPAAELEVASVYPRLPPLAGAGVPAALLERRPDIVAAERAVLAARAPDGHIGLALDSLAEIQQADVLLDTQPNDLAGAVTITTSNGGTIRDVGLRNVNASANLAGVPTILRNLTIIFDNAAVNLPLTTLTGNLAVYAGGGPITQSDVLTVAGTSYLAANANSITLTNPANSFGGSISMFTLPFVTPTTDPSTVITRLHPASITAVGNIDLGPAVIPATIPLPANPFTDGSYSVDGFDHADVSVDGHLSLVASGGNITDSGLVLYYYGGTFQVDGGYSVIIDNNPLFRIYIAGSGGTTISVPETSITLVTGRVQNIAQSVQVLFVDPTYFFNNLDLYTLPGDTIIEKPPAEIILRRIFR